MKRLLIVLLSAALFIPTICIPVFAETLYNGDAEWLYAKDTGKSSAYCWNDLTYNTTTGVIKSDGWITYKNSYPNKFHNCIELNVFSSSDRYTTSAYSDTAKNVVATYTIISGFTWCYANHGVNACGRTNLTTHSYTYDSNSDSVCLYTYIRVS